MSGARAGGEAPTPLTTPDGSRTVHSARFDECYSSRHGAATQAREVFVRGSGTGAHPAPRVLEIGFGLGLNFRATLADTARRGVPLDYLAYEFDPLPAQTLREVASGAEAEHDPLWLALLAAWEGGRGHGPEGREEIEAQVGARRVRVRLADAQQAEFPARWASALYLDGFSPAKNPELWTPELIARLAQALAPGGVLSTYSAAGRVRRALEAAGLSVERRPGPPGKRECLRAVRP